MGSKVLLEQVQLTFSFRNKFIILLPYGLLVDNNTFSKMYVFKSYLWVRQTTTLSQHPFVEAELASHKPRKINEI